MPQASPSIIPADRIVWDEHLHGGQAWSRRLRRHQRLRLRALEDGANVVLQAYNAEQPLERYNMPDTLKAQHCAFLTAPRVLMSDMGRALLSMTADTCGWHDTFTGHSDAAQVAARFGGGDYQHLRNDRHRNARDNLLVELMKHGLGQRDIVAGVNLFTRIAVDGDGVLTFVADHARSGQIVELRAEMDVLIVLSAIQHPLDPDPIYHPRPLQLTIWRGDPPGADDPCRRSSPEAGRALARSEADQP